MYGHPNVKQFVFTIDQRLRRIVEHAKKAEQYQASFHEHANKLNPKSGIYFVKDQGVYLMSAGLPRDIDLTHENGKTSFVLYANGHNPHTDHFDDWYVGGDDISEKMDIETFELALDALSSRVDPADGDILIRLSQSKIFIETFIRKKAA